MPRKAGQAKSRLRSRLRSAEEAADPVREKRPDVGYVLPRPLKAGDTVLLVELDKQAVVLTPPDSGGNVEVQAGIIRTRVNVKSLRLRTGRQYRLRHAPTPDGTSFPSPGSPGRRAFPDGAGHPHRAGSARG